MKRLWPYVFTQSAGKFRETLHWPNKNAILTNAAEKIRSYSEMGPKTFVVRFATVKTVYNSRRPDSPIASVTFETSKIYDYYLSLSLSFPDISLTRKL